MSVDSSELLLKITSKVRELCDIVDKAITSAGKEVDATKTQSDAIPSYALLSGRLTGLPGVA